MKALVARVALATLAACATVGPPAPPPEARVHVVQPGDTPIAIARRYGVEVDALMRVNGVGDPTKLQVGQRLILPRRAPAAPAPEGAPEAAGLPVLGDGAGADLDRAPAAEPPKRPAATEPERTAPAPSPLAAISSPSPSASPSPAPELPVIPPPPPPADLSAMRSTFVPSPKAGDAPLIWPVEGVVVSLFGPREGQRHDGIDIGAPAGTAVWAAADGTVVFAGEQPGYGLLVVLDHPGALATIYAHNAANLVQKGDRVRQGDPIAQVGQSGGAAAPALHFEVRRDKVAVNPLAELPP